jgi:tRNA threonylcarbamoyladenosine modification (KEOPS) complex  Pcc1 subunit
MECSAKIFVKCDAGRLLECLAPEETRFDRSSFKAGEVEGGVEFTVAARDAVALRATLNTISQLLAVFEGAGREGGG